MFFILTDSCADLSQPILNVFDVEAIPLHVQINGIDHFDSDIRTTELFESVSSIGRLPQTSPPSVKEFLSFFDRQEPVIFIGISSQLSETLNHAQLAKDQLAKVDLHLIDSLNVSNGEGLLVLKAVDLMNSGKTPEEIVAEINSTVPKVRTIFMIDTMEYLYKGGRCTGLQAFMGNVLNIRPIIHVLEDGSFDILDKVLGNRKKALDRLLEDVKQDLPNIDTTRLCISHTGCEADAKYLAEELKKLPGIEYVHITITGSTVASHGGPDTIGIMYIKK